MAKGKGTIKHTHRFVRVSGKFVRVWKCADPDCRYLVNQTQEYHVLGNSSLCWGCGAKFVMDEDAMQMDQPECVACRNPEIAPVVQIMNKIEEDHPVSSHDEMRKKLIEMGVLHE